MVRLSEQQLTNQEAIMTTPHKIMEKNAKHKLTLLELAEKLGSVTAACRHMNYSRSQFYEIKRRFQLEGFQGLIDRPPIPKSHPRRKPDRLVKQILAITRQHPAWGHQRIAAQARLEGVSVCAATIRNIWIRRGMTKRYQRWLWAQEQDDKLCISLSEAQVKELE